MKGLGKSALADVFYSIRTRYSFATAFFLLFILGLFYIGGRVVLVHLMREAEQQVREIGGDISRVAYRNANRVRAETAKTLGPAVLRLTDELRPEAVLATPECAAASLILGYSPAGDFVAGAVRGRDGLAPVAGAELEPYAERIAGWFEASTKGGDASRSVGIMQVGSLAHYVSLLRRDDGGFVILGAPFDSRVFSAEVNEGFTGLEIRVTNRRGGVSVSRREAAGVARSDTRGDFGLSPMLSEALNFYSGGFWDIGANPFEAVFAVRDIVGNAVTMITVSLPGTFASVTRSALGRLTFFIAIAGILLVLPIFWFQSRVLLNPLSRMTAEVAALGERNADTDCPRLEWDGKDEFALLALSVNRMLETISRRSLLVAQTEARQKAIIAAVPDSLAVFDRRARLVTIYNESIPLACAVPGQSFPDLVFGADGKRRFEAALEKVFETGVSSEPIRLGLHHASWVPADAPSQFFDVRIVKMDEFFALASIREISDMVAEHRQLVAAREQLKESEKRESMSLLAAGIAHDVNNVLTIIGNTVATTWMTARDEHEREAMAAIHDALRRGALMMRELMDFAGESRTVLTRMKPATIIDDIRLLAARTVTSSILVSYEVGADLPEIDVDPNQFWKVIFNIVKNASEAIGAAGGHIVIRVTRHELTEEGLARFKAPQSLRPGPGVLFTISDDGPGISAELIGRLFDPYVSSKSVGRGLGLATVRSVVEAHGGGVSVSSVVDRGTVFSVFLPESTVSAEPHAAAAEQRPAGEIAGAEVLIVDDDQLIRRTSGILLKSMKVSVHAAADGEEALAVLRRHADTLLAVILDADLGGTSSARLLGKLRASAPKVGIIVSTGSAEGRIARLFAESPYDVFLQKPYTSGELKAALVKVAAARNGR